MEPQKVFDLIHEAMDNDPYPTYNDAIAAIQLGALLSIAESLEKLAGCIVLDEQGTPAIDVYDTYSEFKDNRGQ